MQHFIFNIVVIGALAFMFLKDGEVKLPFDLLSDSSAQSPSVERADAPEVQATSAATPSPRESIVSKPQLSTTAATPVATKRETALEPVDQPAEAAIANTAPQNQTAAANDKQDQPTVDARPSKVPEIDHNAVDTQIARGDDAQGAGANETLPPLAPAVTVSTPIVNTPPPPGQGEEKLPPAVSISVAAAASEKSEPAFMSPKERRRELNHMIEELETFYLDKFTR